MATFLRSGLALVDGEDVRIESVAGTIVGMVFRSFGAMIDAPSPSADRLPLLEYPNGDEDEDDDLPIGRIVEALSHAPLPHPQGGRRIAVRFDGTWASPFPGEVMVETDTPDGVLRWPAQVAWVLARHAPDGVPHTLAGLCWDAGVVPTQEQFSDERRRQHRLMDAAPNQTRLHQADVRDSLALKLTCVSGPNGQLTYATGRTMACDAGNFKALDACPWWVTESLVDDAIWSSAEALSWLAGGQAGTVIRQPVLKASKGQDYLIPDFAFVPDDEMQPVWLVELEKDGQRHAEEQLKEQEDFARTHGYIGRLQPVVRLGIDRRQTWTDVEHGPLRQQACWHLARAAADDSALWLVLSRRPSTSFSRKSATVAWSSDEAVADVFLTVAMPKTRRELEVFGPSGLVQSTVLQLSFHTEEQFKERRRNAKPTWCHPGYMMKFARHWLSDLAQYLASTELVPRAGELQWRVDHGTGRGNTANKARLYLYLQSSGDHEALAQKLEAALANFWSTSRGRWEDQVSVAKDEERRQEAARRGKSA